MRCVPRTFILNRERAVDYLNMLERIYVFDGFAGWDPEVCYSKEWHSHDAQKVSPMPSNAVHCGVQLLTC
jgi:hypothetical protein